MKNPLRLRPRIGDLILRHTHPLGRLVGALPPVPGENRNRTVLHVVGVHLYLEDDEERVLLGLRHPDAKYAGKTWHFLAGHCEQESAISCLVREALEEAGLVIDPTDVELVHVVHIVDAPGGQPRLQMVFRAHRWKGAPELREPDRCLAWHWWPKEDLPEPIVPYTRAAITGIAGGRVYTELGW